MATDSSAPPPSSGGLTYALVGLFLVGATIGMIFLFDCGQTAPPAGEVDAGKPIERSTSFANDDLVIPDLDVEDAGFDAGPPEKAPSKRVTRRVQCNGSLDASAIQSVVSRNRRQVRNCYERALKANNTLQGRLMVRLTVGVTGAVNNVTVGGTLRDASVNACVRNLAASWRFPKPTGGCVFVDAPFSMTPRP